MSISLPDLLANLDSDRPCNILFNSHKNYNYTVEKNDSYSQELFIIVCKNFLNDCNGIDNQMTNTLRYWFLHNIFHIMKNNLKNLENYDENELLILRNYLESIYYNKEYDGDKVIYLPEMQMFNSWIGLTNQEKRELHKKVFLDILYLDDNYFFVINYFRKHNQKFLETTYKKVIDNKGNNILTHLIRSASSKNTPLSFKNFKKLWIYVKNRIYSGNFVENILCKNEKGQRPIHYICYLKDYYYKYLIDEILSNVSLKLFMEQYCWQISRNFTNYFQLEYLIEKIISIDNGLSFEEKIGKFRNVFQKTYENLLQNKGISFGEKLSIISNLRDYGLIKINIEDKKNMGKRLWEELEM